MNTQFLRDGRLSIWALFAVLAAITIISIFWTPFDYSRLMRPIPDKAVLVGSFHQPDLRVQDLATNIFLKTLLGSGDSAMTELSRGNPLADRIAASRTILAYVPDFNGASNPALVVSSWLGAWEKVFRWALLLKPPKDVFSPGEYNCRRVWAYKKPLMISGEMFFLSFAFDEGIFIGCLAKDRLGVVKLLKVCDGQAASIISVPECNSTCRDFPPEADPPSVDNVVLGPSPGGRRPPFRQQADPPRRTSMSRWAGGSARGSRRRPNLIWLRYNSPQSGDKKNIFATWSVDAAESNRIAASVTIRPPFFLKEGGEGKRLDEISRLFPASPALVVAFPSGQIMDSFKLWLPQMWANKINAVIAPQSDMSLLATRGTDEKTSHSGFQPPLQGRGTGSGFSSTGKIDMIPSREGQGGADTKFSEQKVTNNLFAFTVMAGEYGAKYGPEPFRMSMPALLFAVSCGQEEKTKIAIFDLLRFVNFKYRLRLALNPETVDVGRYSIYTLGSLRADQFGFLQPGDWPAFAFCDGFFLLASNAGVLKKLLAKYQAKGNKAGNEKGDWFKWAEDRKAEAFVWIEPRSGWQAIRLALTGSTLMLSRGRPNQAEQTVVGFIKAFRSYLEQMDTDKHCLVWLEEGKDQTTVHFEFGR